MNPNELHPDRLASTTDDGSRVYLYPEKVHGKWYRSRFLVYSVLLLVYLILPWLKINGHQAILIDIPRREFFILGAHFYAHNIPLLFLLLATFIFTIGVITATLGRVWCGWACPQTVFIELVFRKIEEFIEGPARVRKKLDQEKLNLKKFAKKTLKWTVFTFITLVISHSFLAYFVRTEELIKIVQNSPEMNSTLFICMLIVSAIFLFDFGWFKEQFCIIACPYGRLQSVLLDKDSLVVAYDYNRGEPRGKLEDVASGDCINCYKCVQVCPTGIDIRRGNQLECIQCTRCIDACDDIMEHIKKPTGLIRYSTERELEGGKTNFFRPRILIYLTIIILLSSIGSYLIYQSKNVDVVFMRGTRDPYQIVQGDISDTIINHYKVDFFYRGEKEIDLHFKTNDTKIEVVSPMQNIKLTASRKKTVHIFFKFSPQVLKEGSKNVIVEIHDGDNLLTSKELTLVGPFK